MAELLPHAGAFVGIDPALSMVREANAASGRDRRIVFRDGVAESLPFADGSFDLLVATTSFDHWSDQARGLAECARVLRAGAPLVLCDLFSPLLLPTLWLGRQGKARTKPRATSLLTAAGFVTPTWHPSVPLIASVVAVKGGAARSRDRSP